MDRGQGGTPPTRDMIFPGSLGKGYTSPGERKEKLRQRTFSPSAPRKTRPYAELRAASAFSFLDGASLPEDLVARAVALGLPAVGLVDRNGVHGAPRFYKAAREAGLRALVGSELTLGRSAGPRLTLMVESRAGYRNLCRLVSAGAAGKPKGDPWVTWDQLEAHEEGLHVLSGGEESPVRRALLDDGVDAARQVLGRLAALFPGRCHVELQRHYLREEEHENQALLHLAGALRLPLVATNGVRYATRKDKELFDVLTAIRHHTTLDEAGSRLHPNRERCLKGADEIARLFTDLPGILERTADLATRLDFTLADLGYRFPEYPLPPGETPASYLRALTWEGASRRFVPLTDRAKEQLEKELALIEKLQLEGYFLIVWDIVEFCRRERVLVQGRGSAANSAVCYALSITAIDPVKMELLFERFLSEERGEWPDIDLDLPSGDQREKVIQHVYRTYGPHGAAMTANVITYRDRSAAREVAKVLGFSPEQVDRIAKRLGAWSFGEFRDAPAAFDEAYGTEMRGLGFDPDDLRIRHLGRLYREIQNLPRHLGQHSGGMVVAMGRLDEVVPLEPAAMEGRVVIQWDKDDCADLGIIKVDLLGLGMLGAIEEMIPTIRACEGIEVDLAHLPANDPGIYEILNKADTVGLFQVESRAQMASLPRHAPRCFYDIVVQVAIIRPGPIVGGMVHPFFDRRQGRAPVTYAHPSLEPILARTLGVPLFQEQLLKIAMVAAGFTGGEAEELRRAMGFKRSAERMESIETRLRAGMTERGIEPSAQEQIVKSITSFALYGFPESHAASFALIAYASAYLKVHHPAAFYVGLLNAWPMGFYHPATLVKDAERHDTPVLPLDVNRSGWRCRWERAGDGRPGVRLGLRYVKGLRQAAGEAVERAAAERPYTSTADVARRAGVRDDELAALAGVGAFASLGLTRRGALWQAAAIGAARGPLFEVETRQAPSDAERFADGGTAFLGDDEPSPLPEMSTFEETVADYGGASLTAGPHLMAHFRPALARQGILSLTEAERRPDGHTVRVAGAVIVRQRPGTAKGFVFLSLEDETGILQAIIRPDLFKEHRTLIVGSPGLVIEGRLQKRDGTLSVKAERFWKLPAVPEVPAHDFR